MDTWKSSRNSQGTKHKVESKMKRIALFLFFTLFTEFLITTVSGQAFLTIQEERRGHKNECYFKLSKDRTQYFKAGTTKYDNNKCMKYTCQKSGRGLSMSGEGCGVVAANKNCKIVQDKKRRHPGCCPQLICS